MFKLTKITMEEFLARKEKNARICDISYHLGTPQGRKSICEARRALRLVERFYRKAAKLFHEKVGKITNNFAGGVLQLTVDLDKEDVDNCGGYYSPDENTIVLNKYVIPFSLKGKTTVVADIFKDKKQLLRIVVHEFIHYAFASFDYIQGTEEPVAWVVGVCKKENVSAKNGKATNNKWVPKEWLDEILTDLLTAYVTEGRTSALSSYELFVKEEDMPLYKVVTTKLKREIDVDKIINALQTHNADFYLKT